MDTFKIMGIDPGKNVGVTILTVGVHEFMSYNDFDIGKLNNEFVIVNIETHYISLDNLMNDTIHDKQLARVIALRELINKLMVYYMPDVLSIEEAFMNIRYPLAVMQLSQYFSIVLQTALTVNPYLKIFRYPPKLVKSSVGAGGSADKNDMLATVKTINEITNGISTLDSLTEHEIDSLAIAYIALAEIRRYPFILYS